MGRRGAASCSLVRLLARSLVHLLVRLLTCSLVRFLSRLLAPSLALVLALELTTSLPARAAPDCPPSTASLAELGRDLRAQRAQRGHFDGAARNAAVDDYGAARHCLMDALRQALQRNKPGQRSLRQALGAPDHSWRAPKPPAKPLPDGWQPQPGDRLQWYRWRGERDGLLIWLRHGRVYDSGWSLSHE